MENFVEFLQSLFSGGIGTNVTSNILDILFISSIVYATILFIKNTKAVNLIKSILVISILYFVIKVFKMDASSYIFNLLFSNFFIILIIVFAPEIRNGLETIGKKRFFSKFFKGKNDNHETLTAIEHIVKASKKLSEKMQGALIIIEKDDSLQSVVETGVSIDAKISEDLLMNIFFKNSPLHDGAVIIKDNRIVAAGCILPLTERNLPNAYGTRHRAGIGITEEYDAVSIIVSEESGLISIGKDGSLQSPVSPISLKEFLIKNLIDNAYEKE